MWNHILSRHVDTTTTKTATIDIDAATDTAIATAIAIEPEGTLDPIDSTHSTNSMRHILPTAVPNPVPNPLLDPVPNPVPVVTRHHTQCGMRFFDRKPIVANTELKRVCI